MPAKRNSNCTTIHKAQVFAGRNNHLFTSSSEDKNIFMDLTEQLDGLKTGLETYIDHKIAPMSEAMIKNQDFIDQLSLERKRVPLKHQNEVKTFNDIIGEAMIKNADVIRNFKRNNPEIRIDLLPEVKQKNEEGVREVKAVGDMTITANFPNAATLYQDRQNTLIQTPYSRVWLSDILTTGSSTGTSISYPKENGGEGSAGVWEDPTEDKPQIDFDLTTQTGYFKWIAGIVIIDREMLDDIAWMTSYVQNKMLISLKKAENAFILNGTSGTNPVTGLLDAATAYSGIYTRPIDRIIDAAYGQIVEDTDEFYYPTSLILMPRDAVRIGLNTSSGSGEYDLPNGVTAFTGNKLLSISSLDIATTRDVGANNFVTFDKTATIFVRRMVPELRMFEDSTLAKKNKIMFRIEERGTLIILNDNAIVTGLLDESIS